MKDTARRAPVEPMATMRPLPVVEHQEGIEGTMRVDEFMPIYDVSDAVAAVVHADVATTWAALMEVDLIDVGRKRPLVAVLGALRILPDIISHLLHGELPPRQPQHLRLRDLTTIPLDEGGWLLRGCVSRRKSSLASSASSGGR
jgi:hypothetical protein